MFNVARRVANAALRQAPARAVLTPQLRNATKVNDLYAPGTRYPEVTALPHQETELSAVSEPGTFLHRVVL
jgi:uncharacterized protein YraI